jgi:hypothetical protein
MITTSATATTTADRLSPAFLTELTRTQVGGLCVSSTTASVVQWSEFLATDPEARVRFPAIPDFLTSSGSGTGSTQPREYN